MAKPTSVTGCHSTLEGWEVRCAEAAYWASWADALHMVGQQNPEVADMVVRIVSQREPPREGCLAELQDSGGDPLGKRSAMAHDRWSMLWMNPASGNTAWQYWASSISDSFFRKTSLLPVRPEASRAHLRSHSGSNAGTALAYAPTSPEYTIPPHLFRVIVLERLKLQLPVGEASCTGCGAPLDPVRRHRVSCPRTGRVKTRAGPIERVLARICREAGARVRFNALLRDMNVGVPAADNRRIEILAQDLPCFGGAQLAVDVTLRGVLSSAGEPHPR